MQSQSKKCGIYKYGNIVQYSWNVILFLLILFTIVIQTIYEVLKLAYQLNCFLFSENLKWQLYKLNILYIFLYLFILTKKQGDACQFFWFFSRTTGNLSEAPLACYYFESVQHGAIFLLFEDSLHLTEAQKNLFCLNLSSLFLISEWSM